MITSVYKMRWFMFRSSVLLFALTAACGDKDTGFGTR